MPGGNSAQPAPHTRALLLSVVCLIILWALLSSLAYTGPSCAAIMIGAWVCWRQAQLRRRPELDDQVMKEDTHASLACQEHPEKREESHLSEQPLTLALSVAFFLSLLAGSVTCLWLCLAASLVIGTWSLWWQPAERAERSRLKPDKQESRETKSKERGLEARLEQESRETKSKERGLEARLEELQKGNDILQEENAKLVSFTTALHPGQGISDLFVSILDDLLEGYLPEDEELHMVRQMVQCASFVSSQHEYTGSPTELGDLEPWLRTLLLDLNPKTAELPPETLHEITPGLLPFTYQTENNSGSHTSRKDEAQQLQPQPSLTSMLASLASETSTLDAQNPGSNADIRYALLGRILRCGDSGSHASSSKRERAVSPVLEGMTAHATHGKRRSSVDAGADAHSRRGMLQAHGHVSGANALSMAGSGFTELDSGVCTTDSGMHASTACVTDSGAHTSAGLLSMASRQHKFLLDSGAYANDSGMHTSAASLPIHSRQHSFMHGQSGTHASAGSLPGASRQHRPARRRGLQAFASLQHFDSAPSLGASQGGQGSKADAGPVGGTASAISAPQPTRCMPQDLMGKRERDASSQVACPPSVNSSLGSPGKTQSTVCHGDDGDPAQNAATTQESTPRHSATSVHRARRFMSNVLRGPSIFSLSSHGSSSAGLSSGSLRRSTSLIQQGMQEEAQEKTQTKKSATADCNNHSSAPSMPERASTVHNMPVARKSFSAPSGVRATAASSGASSVVGDSPPSPIAPSESNSVRTTVGVQQQARTNATGSMPPVHASRRGSAVSQGGSWQETAAQPAPSHALVLEMEAVLHEVYECWNCDTFRLCEVTQGHPLSTLGYFIFVRTGLVSSLGMQPVKLARFLRRIEAGYRSPAEVPYHNRVHAADVLQTLHVIMHHGGLLSALDNDPLLSLAAYLAALLHDYEHEGCTNDFIINSNSELAITYNDKAPLENHHLAASFRVLLDPDCDFLALPKPEFAQLRKAVIELVLATDMKQHFVHLGLFSALLQKSKSSFRRVSVCSHGSDLGLLSCETIRSGPDPSLRRRRLSRHRSISGHLPKQRHCPSREESREALVVKGPGIVPATSMSGPLPALGFFGPQASQGSSGPQLAERSSSKELPNRPSVERPGPSLLSARGSRPQTVHEADALAWHGLDLTALDASQRLLLLQIVLKCADIGHLAEDREVHVKWVHRLQEEFFRQGDREKAGGLPVSPLFDRDKPGIVSSQPGFFEVVALPLFAALVNAVPGAQPMMDSLQSNYKYWKMLGVPHT